MRDPEQVATVVREWVVKADNDLKAAAQILKLGADSPTDTVCFHAPQCVEKYLKAALVVCDVAFSKTHDLRELVGLLPPATRPGFPVDEQLRLTKYAVALRYPSYPSVPLSEARKAVAIARQVRREIRRMLPRTAIRRRRK